MAIKTSPAGVLVSTPFDGCYSCATRDSFNFYEHVLALVGLTETLVRGAYARAFCFAQDKTKYFCFVAASRIASRQDYNIYSLASGGA